MVSEHYGLDRFLPKKCEQFEILFYFRVGYPEEELTRYKSDQLDSLKRDNGLACLIEIENTCFLRIKPYSIASAFAKLLA